MLPVKCHLKDKRKKNMKKHFIKGTSGLKKVKFK